MKKWFFAIVLLILVAVIAASCGGRNRRQGGEWTPSAVTGSLAIGTRAPELEPVATEEPAQGALPTADIPTRVVPAATAALPTATLPPAVPQLIAPTAAPTRDPNIVIITEDDVLRAVTSGATAESGATLENVGVEFASDGKMILTASRVGYGFVNADNVTLVGRLVAVGGKLQLETESVTPKGIVTAMIPTIANQALQRYTSRWYIEEASTTEGQLQLRVRP